MKKFLTVTIVLLSNFIFAQDATPKEVVDDFF